MNLHPNWRLPCICGNGTIDGEAFILLPLWRLATNANDYAQLYQLYLFTGELSAAIRKPGAFCYVQWMTKAIDTSASCWCSMQEYRKLTWIAEKGLRELALFIAYCSDLFENLNGESKSVGCGSHASQWPDSTRQPTPLNTINEKISKAALNHLSSFNVISGI